MKTPDVLALPSHIANKVTRFLVTIFALIIEAGANASHVGERRDGAVTPNAEGDVMRRVVRNGVWGTSTVIEYDKDEEMDDISWTTGLPKGGPYCYCPGECVGHHNTQDENEAEHQRLHAQKGNDPRQKFESLKEQMRYRDQLEESLRLAERAVIKNQNECIRLRRVASDVREDVRRLARELHEALEKGRNA